jgi:hypothetical protein
MIKTTTDIMVCECNSMEHQIVISHFDDDDEGIVYFSIHLTKKPFFERLKHAIKYIFGYQSRFGAFDEVIISSKDINSLQSVINHIKKVEGNKIQNKLFNV